MPGLQILIYNELLRPIRTPLLVLLGLFIALVIPTAVLVWRRLRADRSSDLKETA